MIAPFTDNEFILATYDLKYAPSRGHQKRLLVDPVEMDDEVAWQRVARACSPDLHVAQLRSREVR